MLFPGIFRSKNPLGRKVPVPDSYSPHVLYRVPRKTRVEHGMDLWRSHEFMVRINGKRNLFLLTFVIPSNSEFYPESKSVKLYLNSFRNEDFSSHEEVLDVIRNDLVRLVKTSVEVSLHPWWDFKKMIYLKDIPDVYVLKKSAGEERKLFLHHFPIVTYCPITHQPDFAVILIAFMDCLRGHQKRFPIDFRGFTENLAEKVLAERNLFQEEAASRFFSALKEELSKEKMGEKSRRSKRPEKFSNGKPFEFAIAIPYARRGGISITPVRATSREFLEDFLKKTGLQLGPCAFQ